MALINLGYIAEFFVTKLLPVTLRKRAFSYSLRFWKNLSENVLILNNRFNNFIACFEFRVPPSTAYMKIYEVCFIRLV